jgi:hypothetical protein
MGAERQQQDDGQGNAQEHQKNGSHEKPPGALSPAKFNLRH